MPSLGETLAAERRRQGKTVIDAETATHIRARMLHALEHGDYDTLPSPAYVKGYIQGYAKFLDIPSEPLLESYRAELRIYDERAAAIASKPIMPRGASYSSASRQNLDDLPADTLVPKREHAHAIPMRAWVVVAIIIIVLGILVWGISRLFAQPTTPSTVPTAVEQSQTPVAGAGSASSVATAPVTSGTPATLASSPVESTAPPVAERPPFKLAFRNTPGHSSALKVTVDGTVVWDEAISDSSKPPAFEVYDEAVVIIGKTSWVTTYEDGVRHATPNGKTSYKLTLKNKNPAQ